MLRADGTCWLNYGSCYASGSGKMGWSADGGAIRGVERRAAPHGGIAPHKPKDLIDMPAFVAEALRADGWYLRSEIVWHKPNPMPESVTDRPTSAHEKLYLLSKSGAALFWSHPTMGSRRTKPEPDYEWHNRRDGAVTAVEPDGWRDTQFTDSQDGKRTRLWVRVNLWRGHDYFYDAEAVRTAPSPHSYQATNNCRAGLRRGNANTDRGIVEARRRNGADPQPANLRNVWSIATRSFAAAHFATFPPDLVQPCIRAGTSERGACAKCGAPWRRVVATPKPPREQATGKTKDHPRLKLKTGQVLQNWRDEHPPETTGWEPTCGCGAETRPCVVLDCFGGAGTVGLVADRLQRDAVLIEISAEYAEMARQRIQEDATLLAQVEVVA